MENMINIMRADLYKIRKSKVILCIVSGLILILCIGNFIGEMTIISDTLNLNDVDYSIKGSKIAIEVLKESGVLVLLMIPLVLNIFNSDFKNNMVKNIITYKYSRTQIILSKWLLCTIMTGLFILGYATIGLLMNAIFNKMQVNIDIADFIRVFQIAILQLPIYAGFIGIIMLIGVVFKSNTAVVSVIFLYHIGVSIGAGLISWINIAAYEPITCLDKAAYLVSISMNEIIQIIGVGLSMVIISLISCLYLYNKKDFN